MALGRYRAVKEFEHNGISYGLGNQLVLEPKEALPFLEAGKVILGGYLDPKDPKDAAMIERISRSPKTFT